MNRVLVVGSLNIDFVVETVKCPDLGETLTGKNFSTFPGGKGANQAIAANRLGAEVTMLGCVGKDEFGRTLLEHLRSEGVLTQHIRMTDSHTGVASITVCQGENSIIVVPGANYSLVPEDIQAAENAFIECDVVLAQLEVPLETIEAAIRLAKIHNKPFLLNPAPAVSLPASILDDVTLLTPNEHELSITLGSNQEWKELLTKNYLGKIMMTHGAQGVFYADGQGNLHHQKSFSVDAVDTTGAGDTFNGALAAFWGEDIAVLAEKACAASALSVTKKGAQTGMPTLLTIENFLKEIHSQE